MGFLLPMMAAKAAPTNQGFYRPLLAKGGKI
jgi:hypothetical protein